MNIAQQRRNEEVVYLKGTLKYVRHLEPDFRFGPDGKWSTVVYLSGPELEKFREWQAKGVKNTLKKDDDGWYTTISRSCQYQVNGRAVGRTAPEVFRMEGDEKIPVTERIGDGSTGTLKIVMWKSPKFPGCNLRWEALKVDNLVRFDYEANPELAASLKKLSEQTEELF